MTEFVSVLALLASLGAAVARHPRAPEWIVAPAGAGIVIAVGAIDLHDAGKTVEELAPTVAFLAALLVLAEGCRRAGSEPRRSPTEANEAIATQQAGVSILLLADGI